MGVLTTLVEIVVEIEVSIQENGARTAQVEGVQRALEQLEPACQGNNASVSYITYTKALTCSK